MANHVKVAVTGAAGQIGYALLFRIASGQMFGPDTKVTLQLLELEAARPALEGVVMELDDCAFPLVQNIVTTSDVNEAMDGVNWALLVGSVPRKQGMERSDLLKINGSIFIAQGEAINTRAADDVRVFVVGNPCNTNCLIAKHHARDIPSTRFYAMTSLDELRAKRQLADKANVDITKVTEMTIWGNHSSTQYPDFENAKINGKNAPEVISDKTWLQETFVTKVQQRGAEILKARGLSSAASAANAVIHGVQCLTTNTNPNDSFSMCISSNGEYGVDKGLIFSFPCRNTNNKLSVVTDLQFSAYGKEKFDATLDELRKERDMVQSLGLLS